MNQSEVTSVDAVIHKIRDTVNESVFTNNINRHGFLWDMVCASMDTVEDTQLAIEAYKSRRVGETGHRYLEIYGLFQAMFLQQDALVKLAKGLELSRVNIWGDADSAYVRNIRNKYFGHPTERNVHGTKQVTYHGIARMSIGTGSLEAWTYPNFKTETIEIKQILKRHEAAVINLLASILSELEEKGRIYMSQFTVKLPTQTHVYEFQKLHLWALGSHTDGIMATASVEILKKELDAMHTGIITRFEKGESVGDVIREIAKARYCLEVIHDGIARSRTDTKTTFNYEAHIDSLEQTFKEILNVCSEINANFQKGSATK